MLYEVFFPRRYESNHPWGDEAWEKWQDSQFKVLHEIKPVKVPIHKVSHVTHDREAEGIKHTGAYFTFKARQKCGKAYIKDGRPLGESYKEVCPYQYEQIPETEPVLPGYYSWWGISLTGVSEAKKIRQAIERELKRHRYELSLADYLKDPPESRYGNNEFSTKLANILQSYWRSRQCRTREVYLKRGGTLRYRQEICYVIVICTKEDLDRLSDFPNLKPEETEVFNSNGLLSENGSIKDYRAVPIFETEYPIQSCNNQSCSWETMAFALYYPSDDFVIRCHKDNISYNGEVNHGYCTSTYPLMKYTDNRKCLNDTEIVWKCPNHISEAEKAEDHKIRQRQR